MASNLAARAAEQVEQQTAPNRPPTIKEQIGRMESQFALAMPRGSEAAQLVRDAITAINTNPQLAECTPASVLGALMTCAQLGLRPGVLGHAWVLPFRSKGVMQAQLVIGYQGLVELAHRTGQVASLIAREVHERDHFDVDYGLADSLIHKPLLNGDRGPVTGYYAIVKFKGGGHSFIYASKADVEAHRDKFSKMKSFGPWVDNFDSMALKTVVRMLAKWMPKSTEFANAISADEGVRVDYSPTADVAQATEYVQPQLEEAPVEGVVVSEGGES
ncbi:recombination protein RecT [Nakamurella lactea]|uniref:recombination protein RecT n=1 Tax=Nakamurella lactea TaxID=459515 RepID=UPI0003FAF795|nr:recombination protein RecT [Nakamurella lactea]